jgi:hypothetical protein
VKANISATVRNGMGLDSLLFGLVATEFEGTSFLGDPIAFSQRFSLA